MPRRKPQHGGKRDGAGRPRLEPTTVKRIPVWLWNWIQTTGIEKIKEMVK